MLTKEDLERLKRVKISQMHDATDRGQKGYRKSLLNEIIALDLEIRGRE